MSLAQGNNTPTRPRIEPGSPDPESDALTTRLVRSPFHFMSMKNLQDSQGQGNSAVRGRIWPNFEPIRELMVVLVSYKNEEDSIKYEGSKVATALYVDFRPSKADNSAGGIWPKLLIQACPYYLQERKRPNQNEVARVATTFYYKSMGYFF